jgi:hypothetical protein
MAFDIRQVFVSGIGLRNCMFDRRQFMSLCILTFAVSGKAFADEWPGYGERRRRRNRDGDHESAHRALRDGRALPLAEILATIKGDLDGDVIDVDLKERAGLIIYKLKVLRPGGELAEMNVDALTGAILKQEGE